MSVKWVFSLTDFPSNGLKAKAYVQLNLKGLLEGQGHNELLELWKIWLYLENNSPFRKREVRTDNRHKKAFALSWATWHIFWQSNDAGHPLSREACFDKAVDLVADPQAGELEDHDLSTMYRRWNKDERVFCMPEVWAEAVFNYRLHDQMALMQKSRSIDLYSAGRPKSENELVKLSKEIRLIKRILKRLRRSPKITQRDLCRTLTVRLSELVPALERLEWEHVIYWDRPARTVSCAWWDPGDKRKFVWLMDSQFPQFGPKLEKGQIYSFSDFNSRVVEEWIRTGAAAVR